MGYRRDSEPSPLRTGLVHACMSLGMFGGVAAVLGLGVHVAADPTAAGPRQTIALFEAGPSAHEVEAAHQALAAIQDDAAEEDPALTGDDQILELAYTDLEGEGVRIDITGGQGGPAEIPAAGIRINGRFVQPGQSFGDVQGQAVNGAGAAQAGAAAVSSALTVAAPQPASNAPADLYARPFENPEGKPMVGLVIGGLGINNTQTQLALDALPPDVTLSFAPDAKRLDYWIKTARAKGHEVLIEVPMEAYEYGRMRMHSDTLIADGKDAANLAKLDQVLGRAKGYFGVINYQGAKFAANPDAVAPVFDVLSQRGLAFIDDGSFDKTVFGQVAAQTNLRFARAAGPIDTRQVPEDIAAELMEVETLAREHGAAMGAGFAFPVTIEAAAYWVTTLDEKGLVLAPVSALVPHQTVQTEPLAEQSRQLRTGRLEAAGLRTGG